jgi:hypothetical protein
MKNNILGLLAIALVLVFSSCKEEPPYINFEPDKGISDTTYVQLPAPSAQPKATLIEEFSGVRCVNCPTGQLTAKSIAEKYPNRVNIVTVHPLNKFNALTRPFDKAIGDEVTSSYDFRTDPGAKILDMVGYGTTGSLPMGNINRRLFSGEDARNIDYQKWSGYVDQEINLPTPVNIDLSAKNIGDEIEIEIKLTYTEIVTDSQYVTISVLESEMEDAQEGKDDNGNSIIYENYIHNHVLRSLVTGYYGDFLNASYEPGRVFYKKYRIKRDAKWNAQNLDVIAFVHLNTTKKNVLHSKEVKVN